MQRGTERLHVVSGVTSGSEDAGGDSSSTLEWGKVIEEMERQSGVIGVHADVNADRGKNDLAMAERLAIQAIMEDITLIQAQNGQSGEAAEVSEDPHPDRQAMPVLAETEATRAVLENLQQVRARLMLDTSHVLLTSLQAGDTADPLPEYAYLRDPIFIGRRRTDAAVLRMMYRVGSAVAKKEKP